ncbi:MAG TPA: alpha/beta fold hydrolase [Xanthobacteraceae bacterium]|nr:alpha/beta fold hydrolase [Xanthobacteraceae bacterium]
MPLPLKVLLFPGFDGTGRLFRSFIRSLPPAIMPSIVPYPADIEYRYDELVEFAEHSLPVDRPFAMVAESFSGPVAIRLAAAKPPGLKSLVLVNTFIRPSFRWIPVGAKGIIGSYLFRVAPPVWLVRHFGLGSNASEESISEVRAALTEVKPRVLACRAREALSADFESDFMRVTVPMLYLRGTKDRLLAPGVASALQKRRPDLEVASLDAPHFALQRRPAEAAAVISQFLLRSAEDQPQ